MFDFRFREIQTMDDVWISCLLKMHIVYIYAAVYICISIPFFFSPLHWALDRTLHDTFRIWKKYHLVLVRLWNLMPPSVTCYKQRYDSTEPLHHIFTLSPCFRANDDIQKSKRKRQEHSCALKWDQLFCKTDSNSPWHAFSLCQLVLSQKTHYHCFCVWT